MAHDVFLPKTAFPMKQRVSDAEVIARWEGLYDKLRLVSKGCPKFILQDGPPFANGKPHMGTAFNRVLKDIIIRYKQMNGFDAPFIPGWDCHGLPIEWKVEEEIRAERKKNGEDPNVKTAMDLDAIIAFRKRCREFAEYWINVQRDGFKKLGTIADWDNPYLTMNPASEAKIVSGVLSLLKKGAIYRGYKPVMWSPVEATALSDAEIEYKDKTSKSIYVAFPVCKTDLEAIKDAKIVIWTTTPWTIPGNRAICYSDKCDYVVLNTPFGKVVVAADLMENFVSDCGVGTYEILGNVQGASISKTICRHPLFGKGYDFDVPLLPADHVTTDVGTGFVHTAPGHGLDDFAICKKFGIDVPLTVKEDGTYYDSVPLFAGQHIYKADASVIELLQDVGALLGVRDIAHSYPHSWRSKAPLIFRATEQWFIDLDKSGIRSKALEEIENVTWLPEKGKNRIKAFVEGRKEWCISRQRVWGIPLMFFINKNTREVLIDDEVSARIVEIVGKEGSDAWYKRDNSDFLGTNYDADLYQKVFDIVDVWLESGSVYSYVTLSRTELAFPADLYLEGSDQHRGWFQSSLLTCVGTHSVAPYKMVLTHGFIVDESGYKMSKSLGNVVDPLDVLKKYGVDVLRMWVANGDYTEDTRIGNNILDQQQDLCRKFRNVIKYLLGALNGFTIEESIDYDKMDDLEKWALSRLKQVSERIDEALSKFNLRMLLNELKSFCFTDLSSFYFDVRKDCLYCDGKGSFKRRGYRTVLHQIFNNLVRWLAPIMSVSMDEAWSSIEADSVHEQRFLEIPNSYLNTDLLALFGEVRCIRDVINVSLERARELKKIGSNLQAKVTVYSERPLLFDADYWAELCIVSTFEISKEPISGDEVSEKDGISVLIEKCEGEKCERCWKIFSNLHESNLCTRCTHS